jgi:hypothetical protein
MIPMFSMECRANSRFSSCWKIAYTTPPTAENAPTPRTRTPNQTGRTPSQSTRTRISAYTAILIMMPLISADTGAGAIGWARGSQTCNGMTPAFVPIPTNAASAIPTCSPDPEPIVACPLITPALASRRIAIQVPTPPRWVTAR